MAAQPTMPGSGERRRWLAVAGVALLLAALRAGLDPTELVNPGGWSQLVRFLRAMVSPRLDREFLQLAATESAVTVGYALLGTAVSLAIGAVGGILIAERGWSPLAGPVGARRWGWFGARTIVAVPRSIHEVVFGLLLVNILGLDPLVAILAIGLPFGAVTAKVFAELLDEAPADAERALRAAGASRLTALVYGTLPHALGDLVSYGFYRFECALRSAAVLGIVGAGGLGFQLALSFISLRYDEMWTFLWALIILSGLADRWSSAVRRRRNSAAIEMHIDDDGLGAAPRWDRLLVVSALVCAAALPVAYWWLGVDLSNLWSGRARTLSAELVASSWPPRIGRGGFGGLAGDAIDTVALAVLSVGAAVAIALPLSLLGARQPGSGPGRAITGWLVRAVLLVARSIPPPVLAFVAVFVFFPGLWPGAVALAVYNGGVLGRLQAEVVENLDDGPRAALGALGASRTSALGYAVLPTVGAKFTALGLYRWEVAIRETVVVGVVGAAGLGRRLDEQTSAFDYDGILATILALVGVTIAVDVTSSMVRRAVR